MLATESNVDRPGILLHRAGEVLGVGLVLAEQGEACCQQGLQLVVLGRRDERGLKRAVHRFVIADFVSKIGAIEGMTSQAAQASQRRRGDFSKRRTRPIRYRRYM